jgi:hypothetical protein
MNIRLQGAFLCQIHDHRYLPFAEQYLIVRDYLVVAQFFKFVSQHRAWSLQGLDVSVRWELVDYLHGVVVFVQVVETFVDATVVAHSNQVLPLVPIERRQFYVIFGLV